MSRFNDRTGETKTMDNNLKASIINYRNNSDIDIKFENGYIVTTSYAGFKSGSTKCPMVIEHYGKYCKLINPNTKHKTEFLIDAEDLERVMLQAYWWNSNGCIVSRINGKLERLHRFILNPPRNMQIDHINTDETDNRKHNLRICTHAENQRNKIKYIKSTSIYKGVSWNKNRKKWCASVTLNRKQFHMGFHDCEIEAAKTYNEAALKYHGEFANLNDI